LQLVACSFFSRGIEIAFELTTEIKFMNRKTFIPVLLIVAIASIAYAIYRSTTDTVTQMENGRQVVYGQPMHGLMLGLCIFAGFCILGVVWLMDKPDVRTEERVALSKRTLNT